MFVTPMDWVNTTVYDYKNQLKSGSITLYMWTYADDMQNEDLLHPLGTVVSNPNVEQTTALTITFHRFEIVGIKVSLTILMKLIFFFIVINHLIM